MTILIPKHREIIRDIYGPQYKVSGHFRITARSARYKGERVLADFDNLILDQGLQRIIGNGGIGSGYIQLGSGNLTPANGQTSLQTYLSSVGNQVDTVDSYVPGPPSYSQSVFQYLGTVGGNTGTFYEIGIGWASVGSLFSRALIVDGANNPNPITVLADEQLSVYYTFRWYFPLTDNTGTITINGSNYNWTARAAKIDYPGLSALLLGNGFFGLRASADRIYDAGTALSTVTATPTGGFTSSNNAPATVYTAPNLYADTVSVYPPSSTPVGGVSVNFVRLYGQLGINAGIQTSFTPAIPKTNVQTLTLTTRATIARYP